MGFSSSTTDFGHSLALTPTLIEKLHKLFYLLSNPANQGGEESI